MKNNLLLLAVFVIISGLSVCVTACPLGAVQGTLDLTDEIVIDDSTYSDEVNTLLVKLEKATEDLYPALEKARKGDALAKKQLIKSGVVIQVISGLANAYEGYMSSDQIERYGNCFLKIENAISTSEFKDLIKDLDMSDWVDESLAHFDKVIDKGIPLGEKILNGDVSSRKELLNLIYDAGVEMCVLQFADQTPVQKHEYSRLMQRVDDAFNTNERRIIEEAVFPPRLEKDTHDEVAFGIDEETDITPADPKEIDEFIDRFEKYLNRIIPIMKKAVTGDNTAAEDYNKIAEEGQAIAAEAQKYVPQLNDDQMKRWQEVASKYAEEVQKISSGIAKEKDDDNDK